jgi:signal transduction histidine kinase
MKRDLEQARDLELALVRLRWLFVAYGVVQTVVEAVDPHGPTFAATLGAVVTIGLALGNIAFGRLARRTANRSELRWIGAMAFVLDTVVILVWVWIAANEPSDPEWVIAYLLPIEGAVRYGLPGAFAPLPILLVSEFAREVALAGRFPGYRFSGPALAFRVGMAAVIALVAGLFASSLGRERDRATERTAEAEQAAALAEEAARREAEARRDLSAFHTAILAGVATEDPTAGMQAIAEAVGHELGCESLGVLLLEPDENGIEQLVAAGVFGDPGYRRGTRFVSGSEPFGTAPDFSRPHLREDRSEAEIPLRAGERVIGILHERASATGGLDRDRMLLLGRLADQVSLVIQATRLRARQEETLVRLRELDELKSDFVAITSHELRTPLTAVRGFVDALRRRQDELSRDEVQEYLSIIHLQTDRLIRLVEDLLLISRIEAGKLTFVPETIATGELLVGVRQGLGELADRVTVIEEPAMPAELVVDPQRLIQVLTNLLMNALKFSPPDKPVHFAAGSYSTGTVTFSIRDRGPGIPPAELDIIFDRFHQTGSAAAHSEGAGLGLYIARQLTRAMGGWISVESEAGHGATFSVTIPTSRNLEVPAPLFGAGRAD